EFVEITPPEKIVFIHHEPVHVFRMTMIFTEEEGKTRIVWQMRFETPADAEKFRKFIIAANEQNFDRLEAVLQSTTP
ncbi:MAG: ATPase, partial [Verrucomicrobiaceae bacterium]